jgi:hypothetical protein
MSDAAGVEDSSMVPDVWLKRGIQIDDSTSTFPHAERACDRVLSMPLFQK